MTTLKTLIASAIVAVSAAAAFADSSNQDQRDIYAVFANPVLVEGRNAVSSAPALPRSESDAGVYDLINADRPALTEGRNATAAPAQQAGNENDAGIYATIHGGVAAR